MDRYPDNGGWDETGDETGVDYSAPEFLPKSRFAEDDDPWNDPRHLGRTEPNPVAPSPSNPRGLDKDTRLPTTGYTMLSNFMDVPVDTLRELDLDRDQGMNFVNRVGKYFRQITQRIPEEEPPVVKGMRGRVEGMTDEEIVDNVPGTGATPRESQKARSNFVKTFHKKGFPPERMRDGLGEFLDDDQSGKWNDMPDGGGNGTPGLANPDPPSSRVRNTLRDLTGKYPPEDLTQTDALDSVKELVDESGAGAYASRVFMGYLNGRKDNPDLHEIEKNDRRKIQRKIRGTFQKDPDGLRQRLYGEYAEDADDTYDA